MAKDYILHDAAAFSDIKLQMLVSEVGLAGYGFYWAVIESLWLNGGTLPRECSKVLAQKTYIDSEKGEVYLRKLIEHGLLVEKGGVIYSERLSAQLEGVRAKRANWSEGQKKRLAKRLGKDAPTLDKSLREDGATLDQGSAKESVTITSTITSTITDKEGIVEEDIEEETPHPAINSKGNIQIGLPQDEDENRFMTDEEMESFMTKLSRQVGG